MDDKLRAERRRPSGAEASGSAYLSDAAPPMYGDAPPSYEDAIASDLPPIDAPRPNYAPPPPVEDDILRGDEKKGFGRRDS